MTTRPAAEADGELVRRICNVDAAAMPEAVAEAFAKDREARLTDILAATHGKHVLQNVTESVAAILKRVSEGKMSVSTGRDLVSIIDVQRKSIELVEIEKRIEALERGRGG
jgi:hypothetical protein